MSVMSELNLQQREGPHSEFNATKVVVATAATLVNDIFEQTGMHALNLSTTACLPSKRLQTKRREGRLRS